MSASIARALRELHTVQARDGPLQSAESGAGRRDARRGSRRRLLIGSSPDRSRQVDEDRAPKLWQSVRAWLEMAAALTFDDAAKREKFAKARPERERERELHPSRGREAPGKRVRGAGGCSSAQRNRARPVGSLRCRACGSPPQVDFEQLRREAAEAEAACSALGSPVVFCHNDLLAPNILAEEGPGSAGAPPRLHIIDFEYGGYNCRDFDFGNHFNEWAGLDADYSRCVVRPCRNNRCTAVRRCGASPRPPPEPPRGPRRPRRYPSEAQRRAFIAAYLGRAEGAGARSPAEEARAGAGRAKRPHGCTRPARESSRSAGLGVRGDSTAPQTERVNSRVSPLCPSVPSPAQLELDALVASATAFSLASHLYWGVWALIQARHSPIDFDFLDYHALRRGGRKRGSAPCPREGGCVLRGRRCKFSFASFVGTLRRLLHGQWLPHQK